MRKGFDEGIFIKDNVESAFHCILFKPKRLGTISEAHYHNYIEILYGISCNVDVWVNDESFNLHDGDLIIINSGETHAVRSESSNNSYYVIKFFPEVLKNDAQFPQESKFLIPMVENEFSFRRFIPKDEIIKTNINAIIKQIYEEWDKSEFGYEMALRGGSLMLYAQLTRIWQKCSDRFEIYDETTKTIIESASFSAAHFSEITEEEMAERCCMSYSYFSRMFKKVMKKSFTSYINEQRINHARRLLLTTRIPITQIAQDCGFSSSSHFIYNFRKKTGFSPLEYRKNNSTLFAYT